MTTMNGNSHSTKEILVICALLCGAAIAENLLSS